MLGFMEKNEKSFDYIFKDKYICTILSEIIAALFGGKPLNKRHRQIDLQVWKNKIYAQNRKKSA